MPVQQTVGLKVLAGILLDLNRLGLSSAVVSGKDDNELLSNGEGAQ